MPLSDHVQLTITTTAVGLQQPGYGVPLILSASAAWSNRVRFYTSLSGVSTDFPVTSSPEYLSASALFSQTPAPSQIAIGRLTNLPTQQYVINVQTVRNTYAYGVNVAGQGVTTTATSFTSSGGATNDTIVTGIVAALNAVTGANYTAASTGSVGSKVCTVTANAAGNWFSLEINSPNITSDDLRIKQTHADPGVAADLNAILLETSAWYAVWSNFNSNAVGAAIAAWTEANGAHIFICQSNETGSIQTTVGNGDLIDTLHTSAYTRTMGAYHPSPVSMFGAAWFGRVLPIQAGSESWKFKTLNGVPAVQLTATHRTNLVARNGNSYQNISGLNITWEGTDANGGFMDVIRGIDYLSSDMQSRVFLVLTGQNKVPYTDQGISQIAAAVRASLKNAQQLNILSTSVDPVVTVPTAASLAGTTQKASRILPYVQFSATLAGAIHDVQITGVVSS